MERSTRLQQVKIYTGKCFRVFRNDKGWKTLICAAIITLIITSVTSAEMFKSYRDTRNGAFALLCACIWIGIFNSIQSVCKERDIIKREHRSGLHISSYIAAHMVYEMALCAVESIIVTGIISATNINNFPKNGVLFPSFLELLITFFFVIYSSDVLGLMVSSIVKSPNTAMTVMPFVLILQLVMSGMIFDLSGVAKVVSNFTISKWGLNAICVTANVNEMRNALPNLRVDYEFTKGHLAELWGVLIAFTILYGIISIAFLKMIDRDER